MESFHLRLTLVTSHHQPPFQKGTVYSLGEYKEIKLHLVLPHTGVFLLPFEEALFQINTCKKYFLVWFTLVTRSKQIFNKSQPNKIGAGISITEHCSL